MRSMEHTNSKTLIHVINNEILLLNALLQYYELEFYTIPINATEDHVRRMLQDLNWVMNSTNSVGDSTDAYLENQYEKVQSLLEALMNSPAPSGDETQLSTRDF